MTRKRLHEIHSLTFFKWFLISLFTLSRFCLINQIRAQNPLAVCSAVLLQHAQSYRWSNTKPSIQRFRELSLKSVDELHCLRHSVKGYRSSSIIQVHTDPCGTSCSRQIFIHLIVPGGVSRVWAQETPGFIIVSQKAVRVLTFTADALEGNSNGKFTVPLCLPVMP